MGFRLLRSTLIQMLLRNINYISAVLVLVLTMATDDKFPDNNTPDAEKSSSPQETNDSQTHQPLDDRALLVSKAKSFLQSPQISGQDLSSKREFLREKGLHEVEIDHLLHDVVSVYALERRNQDLNLRLAGFCPSNPPTHIPATSSLSPPQSFTWLVKNLLVACRRVGGSPLHISCEHACQRGP